ncbi:hypothetical protein [Swaminathania salitolerans]|uniref:Lysozyme inhibitor LprI N-terminal domain-containing protein n=1 Tax=Swaminathania salitolerans TaxID=182838 RepID=A0A511BKX5_9PROT|nr:hypothetical protein [Swaminathania salitolerans]GBQ09613.1 hypothetical protein AA21291_0138 [Swaminathania salitolerans LMG 21291]GEL00905.1 hypothetical protein SSA02_00680 [Swaminathania salitolerans]
MSFSARQRFLRPFARLTACGLFASTLLASGLASGTARAAGCGESPAHEAFNVQGLKSELMVTALSCNAQERYNAFVAKFRPKLTAEEERLNTYFKSAYGRGAQRAHDDYITQLANVQSEGGLKAGTIFCQQRVAMFDEVDALEDGADLAHYADAKDVIQPASFETCSAPDSGKSTHGSSKRRGHRKTRA